MRQNAHRQLAHEDSFNDDLARIAGGTRSADFAFREIMLMLAFQPEVGTQSSKDGILLIVVKPKGLPECVLFYRYDKFVVTAIRMVEAVEIDVQSQSAAGLN